MNIGDPKFAEALRRGLALQEVLERLEIAPELMPIYNLGDPPPEIAIFRGIRHARCTFNILQGVGLFAQAVVTNPATSGVIGVIKRIKCIRSALNVSARVIPIPREITAADLPLINTTQIVDSRLGLAQHAALQNFGGAVAVPVSGGGTASDFETDPVEDATEFPGPFILAPNSSLSLDLLSANVALTSNWQWYEVFTAPDARTY